VGVVDVGIGTETIEGSEAVVTSVFGSTGGSQAVEAPDGATAETVVCGAVDS
jgi:hypothetical protein